MYRTHNHSLYIRYCRPRRIRRSVNSHVNWCISDTISGYYSRWTLMNGHFPFFIKSQNLGETEFGFLLRNALWGGVSND